MKLLLQSFVIPLFLAGSAIVIAAQTTDSPAPKQSQEAPINTGSMYGLITGRVVGDDGPVPFASIVVSSVGNRLRGASSRTVTSDADGNFKVDGLRPIAWNVSAAAPGYVSETTADEETSQRYHQIGESITIRLIKGGVITGRVLSTIGEPLIGVRVNAQLTHDLEGRPATGGTAGADFLTDDRGIYRIYGLRAGAYVVVASPSSGFPNSFRPSAYDGDVPVYHPASTRDAAAEVIVNSGGETAGIDIQYRSEKGHAISGTIAGAASESGRGGRFGGFTSVTLTYAATGTEFNRAFIGPRGRGTPNRGASTSDSFAVYGVPDGQYEVVAYRNTPEGDAAASSPRSVVVSGRDVTGIELTLKPLASIAARLQIEAVNKCPSKRKPSFEEQVFTVRLDEAKEPKPSRAALRPSVPNRAGELMFRELGPGVYRFVPNLLDENLFIRSITAPAANPIKTAIKTSVKPSPLDAGRNGLSLKSGERATGVTITLTEGAAAVQGQVKAAGESTLPSPLTVFLIPFEREKADEVLRYSETRVTDHSRFKLNNLMPGKYWVLARPTSANFFKPISWSSADRTKLRKEAEAMNQVVELAPCQRLMNYELQYRSTAGN